MVFYADLHLHSKHAYATSRDCDLEHLSFEARRKGVALLATGDFTHPGWFAELEAKLVPAEPGLFRLRPEIERQVASWLPRPDLGEPTRFLLEVEISTVYKKNGTTRRVHHLVYAAGFEQVRRITAALARIGNLASDGRPILKLDSRDLLEITLGAGEDCYLIPAHIWTPWYAALGSRSGFDSIEACYGDLSHEIFAVETGLSSDPRMNRRLSALDRFTLVSSSDAHSPGKIAREACAFDTALDYFAVRRALETREGWAGTVEFFPEEGKYHLDGHRKCGVVLTPSQTHARSGACPVCGRSLTLGVLHRIDALADRDETAVELDAPFRSFVPLAEVIAEVRGVGPKTKTVTREYEQVVARVGPELAVLESAETRDIERASPGRLAEAIERMREGRVVREPGYDGQYGRIRLLEA